MQDRLESFGGKGKPLLFAHANGYPPGSYRQFIEPLLEHCELTAYKHRPLWSTRLPRRRLNWNYFADDMLNTIKANFDRPIWMMGHSMGAVIAMIAASKAPRLFQGLVLIDPVFLPGRHAFRMRLTSDAKLRSMPMIKKTLKRPNVFENHQAAFDFHRAKRPFAAISDEVLWDYIRSGTRTTDEGTLELAFGREWEAGVYASPPWVWPRLSRMKLPTLGLRGETSSTLTEDALNRWGRLQPNAQLHTCPGGHLLPMEQPASTSAYVIDFLSRHSD
jgi:pimeloyl-ACP methyl ester carboxylesterase